MDEQIWKCPRCDDWFGKYDSCNCPPESACSGDSRRSPVVGQVDEMIQFLRDAGVDAWDDVEDVEALLGRKSPGMNPVAVQLILVAFVGAATAALWVSENIAGFILCMAMYFLWKEYWKLASHIH